MTRDLDYWKDWASRNEAALGNQDEKMDRREKLYRGEIRELRPLTERDTARNGERKVAAHVRNIVAENIESEVSSTIPQPKVTARRQSDEGRAKILEDMLRNELDRLPMETLNDLAERLVPIQGGVFWMVEWDESDETKSTRGDVKVTLLHPKQVIPQDGIFTSVEDMDAIVLKIPQTRSYIERAYNKKLDETETEEDPQARTLDDESGTAEDLVTQYIAYYRNDDGGVGRFSWVNDTVLEDLPDYQSRRNRICKSCGTPLKAGTDKCPVCGSDKSTEKTTGEEEIWTEEGIRTTSGMQIPGAQRTQDEMGLPSVIPTKLPYFTPDNFPVYLQRNVSIFGQLLGDSDVDKIADQQNTLSRIETKIIERMIKAGSRITLPDRADLRMDPQDNDVWYVGNVQDAQLIKLHQFNGNLQYEMAYLNQVYEEARQILGITNSYQGRTDDTAQSGVAKQFAAAQSAGRLESRRVLKEAAYAELFKRIVQLKVAYADERRPVVATDDRGDTKYEEFDRYDFYEQDPNTGEWYCILQDDRFLFSCDTSAPLANNRPQMWQENTQMLQMGAYGDPKAVDTLLLYWTKMELLHYPGASDTKEYLEKLKAEQMQMQQQQMIMQQQMQMAQIQAQREAEAQKAMLEREKAAQTRGAAEMKAIQSTMNQARKDAMQAAKGMAGRQGPVPVPQR